MARWFPPAVVGVLKARGPASHKGQALYCPHHHRVRLYCLPEVGKFPVLVAVRMTLSFPGLISAVPLYFVHFGHLETKKPVRRAWFSDGGISSNFPIHFFDKLLPSRPTFAISLGRYPGKPAPQHDVYYRNPKKTPARKAVASDSVGAFAAGILDTMQNWSDLGQSRIEGFRDRIVEVRQRPDEGGLNLDMPRDTIISLALRGHHAAVELKAKFKFDRHRLKRYDSAMARLQSELTEMADVFDPSYRRLVVSRRSTTKANATDALLAFGRRGTPPLPNFETDEPHPLPDLRIVARY
jgi:predicted acylesterase/phospholipase RssA